MKKIQLALLSSLFCFNLAQANNPCNGFGLKINNNLTEDLIVYTMYISGAELIPAMTHIKKQSSQLLAVDVRMNSPAMISEVIFYTAQNLAKRAHIAFTLDNSGSFCNYTDISSSFPSHFSLEKSTLPNQADYTIGYQ